MKLSFEFLILCLDSCQIGLEFANLFSSLVLDPEVFELDFYLSYRVPQLVLLLDVGDQLVEVVLQSRQLHVDFLSQFVLLGLLEEVILYLLVQPFDLLNDSGGILLDVLDLLQNLCNFILLRLQVCDYFIDSSEVLIPIQVLGYLGVFSFHELEHLLLVLQLRNRLLDILLDLLYLLALVVVLNFLLLDLLLLLEDLLVDRLLVLFPLSLQLLQLVVERGHLLLEHVEVLSLELLELLLDLPLLLHLLLDVLEVLVELSFGLFKLLLLVGLHFICDLQAIDQFYSIMEEEFTFDIIYLFYILLDLSFLLLLELVNIELLLNVLLLCLVLHLLLLLLLLLPPTASFFFHLLRGLVLCLLLEHWLLLVRSLSKCRLLFLVLLLERYSVHELGLLDI